MNNEEKILEMLIQMQADMVDMKADMAGMKADMVDMKADMVDMKADMAGMKERINQIDARSQRTAVLLETEIDRKLNLLYEGHESIMEYLDKLATKSRVEILENDVALLKDVVKLMRQEIAELKKAQ